MKQEAIAALLQNWADFNAALMTMSEEEVKAVLDHEKANKGRIRILLRAYHRYSKLRGTREKAELATKAKG